MRYQGISEDVFAPGHLTLRGTGTQAHPLPLQDEHHVIDFHSVTDKVCTQQACVCIADAEGLETLA